MSFRRGDIVLADAPWLPVFRWPNRAHTGYNHLSELGTRLLSRVSVMELFLVQAIYEDGVLKSEQPLPLAEHQRVQVSVQTVPKEPASANVCVSRAKATSGMLGWTGDAVTVERLALDPEFGVEESL